MLSELIQQNQIGQLGQTIDRANEDIVSDVASVKVAAALNQKVDHLALLFQAMFELMQQTTGVTEAQLKAKVAVIDLRDEQAGGQLTPKGKPCPKCGAMMPPQFGGCQPCGYRDVSMAARVALV